MAPVDLTLVGQYYAIVSRAMTEGTKIAVENAVRMVTMGTKFVATRSLSCQVT